jgi:hypothetical protein
LLLCKFFPNKGITHNGKIIKNQKSATEKRKRKKILKLHFLELFMVFFELLWPILNIKNNSLKFICYSNFNGRTGTLKNWIHLLWKLFLWREICVEQTTFPNHSKIKNFQNSVFSLNFWNDSNICRMSWYSKTRILFLTFVYDIWRYAAYLSLTYYSGMLLFVGKVSLPQKF